MTVGRGGGCLLGRVQAASLRRGHRSSRGCGRECALEAGAPGAKRRGLPARRPSRCHRQRGLRRLFLPPPQHQFPLRLFSVNKGRGFAPALAGLRGEETYLSDPESPSVRHP